MEILMWTPKGMNVNYEEMMESRGGLDAINQHMQQAQQQYVGAAVFAIM